MRSSFGIPILLVACINGGTLLAKPILQPPNLIVNGGFETPVVVGLDDNFSLGSTAITGWTVTGGNVDVNTSGSSVLGDAHSGLQMIDMNGSTAGEVSQTFATVPGESYALDLFYSNNPNPAFSSPFYTANVIVEGNTTLVNEPVTHGGATQANMNWLPVAETFVADSTTTTLLLQSSIGGFNGVYFDTVSITLASDLPQSASVPEPSTLVLGSLIVLGGCGLALRRRVRSRSR